MFNVQISYGLKDIRSCKQALRGVSIIPFSDIFHLEPVTEAYILKI